MGLKANLKVKKPVILEADILSGVEWSRMNVIFEKRTLSAEF